MADSPFLASWPFFEAWVGQNSNFCIALFNFFEIGCDVHFVLGCVIAEVVLAFTIAVGACAMCF